MLKLINTGLGRTGTTSLKLALERLGFGACYHMFDVVNSADRLAQWEKVVYGEQRPQWQAIFDGYSSVVDGPSAIYYEQIMAAFPGAKVMLSVRDAESWYRSTYDTLYQVSLNGGQSARGMPGALAQQRSRVSRMSDAMTWDGLFGGRFGDKEYAIEVYLRHNQQVIDRVGRDNVLVWDVSQGWEPLCAFLDVPAPAGDFPRLNDTGSMRKVLGLS